MVWASAPAPGAAASPTRRFLSQTFEWGATSLHPGHVSKNKRGGQDITIAARPDMRTKTTTQFDTLLPSPVAFIGAQRSSPPPPGPLNFAVNVSLCLA